MSLLRQRAAWLGCLVFVLVATLADLAWANGQEFFAAPMVRSTLASPRT